MGEVRKFEARKPLTAQSRLRGAAATRRRFLEHKLWQAERIGWEALAESFRRDLNRLTRACVWEAA